MLLALAHWAVPPGSVLELRLPAAADGPGWTEPRLTDLLVGAGLRDGATAIDGTATVVRASRARSLPDTVAPGMGLLVCGLNPSEYAADRGVGYARPGNRFWPAALEAGVVTRSHDPLDALLTHGVGMTDLVKRATARASDVAASEYRSGAARVERLVRWLRPRVVCFVGLAGWRAAVDSRAVAGRQPQLFGGRPAYVMPSTSGLNAHASREDLVQHLAAAAELALREQEPAHS